MAIKKAKYTEAEKAEDEYIRVGTEYFKRIIKTDRFGIDRVELKKWNKETIESDFYKGFTNNVAKYDDFTLVPDNKNYEPIVNNCYNMYKKFSHKPKEGSYEWTMVLLNHIFGNKIDLGIRYLQVLYLYPRQAMPILALVSKERSTGKSTFIDWISVLFGANFVLINPQDLLSDFNGIYATSNIIAIEEAVVEKSHTVEKVKALSTQKNISTNIKMVQNFMLPFFGKIIMASNNEDKFIRIDEEEIRFWVIKLETPKINNHNILNDIVKEIPAFLYYLESLPLPDLTKSRQVFTNEEINNDSLLKIKSESMPTLYKELIENFTDFFNNEIINEDVVLATPKEIKERFFSKNNQINSPYIKDILINHFKFEKSDKNISYKSLDGVNFKTGQPFFIKKSAFLGSNSDENMVKYDDFVSKTAINERILTLKNELSNLEQKLQDLNNQYFNQTEVPF